MPRKHAMSTRLAILLACALMATIALGQERPPQPSSSASVKTPAAAAALQPWEPDAKQQAVLDSLPRTIEEQRAELIRLAQIPLPSYEERRRFLDLMGDGFPKSPEHSLRRNAPFLLEYYRNLPKPTQQDLDALVASVKQRMIFVKGGSFTMGDFGPLKFKDKLTITGDSNNDPHEVSLDSFSIMKGRVTFGEFDLYLRSLGRPVMATEHVTVAYANRPGYVAWPIPWPDADGYCRWLAKLSGQPFQLPTEAQWEYAAREGGKFIAYPMHGYPAIQWYSEYVPTVQSTDESLRIVTARAGQKLLFIEPQPPWLYGENRIGMQGVVGFSTHEWVADWYGETYFHHSATHNPRGPETGTQRVARPTAYGRGRTVLSRRGYDVDKGLMFRCAINATQSWR
jgi:formylglycine-generating enzyme required for sulfatase activity